MSKSVSQSHPPLFFSFPSFTTPFSTPYNPLITCQTAYGPQTPTRLQTHLKKIIPTPHIRTFLGPDQSYITWDPSSIRWANLPPSLEDTLQSWLTPSGWKFGPPRLATWGRDGAFFTMSEYGNVAYRLGSPEEGEGRWEIWAETVDEWRAERAFVWSDVVYVVLDASVRDQFFAVRADGTWAGSIDDVNEEALSAFAANFFGVARVKRARAAPQQSQQTNGGGAEYGSGGSRGSERARNETPVNVNIPPDPATQAIYERWATDTATMFAAALAANNSTTTTSNTPTPSPSPLNATAANPKRAPRKLQIRSQSSTSSTLSTPTPPYSPTLSPTPHPPPSHPSIPTTLSTNSALLTSFPYLPPSCTLCTHPICVAAKSNPAGLRACTHDVERLLRASGLYSYEWLRQERIRWHPDRFGRLCEEGWREEGRKIAEEMFKVVEGLLVAEGGGRGGL